MKALIALCLSLCAALLISCSGEEEMQAPEVVQTTFETEFGEVAEVQWEQEADGSWEADFEKEGQEMEALFSEDGEWLETEWEIDEDELPALVAEAIEADFAEHEIEEVERVLTPRGISYELELVANGQELEVEFSESGELLSSSIEPGDREDEEEVGKTEEEETGN